MDKTYQLSDTRLMSECGMISEIEIIPYKGNSYALYFCKKDGDQFYLKTQRGSVRQFRTIDSAFSVVKSLELTACKLRVVLED